MKYDHIVRVQRSVFINRLMKLSHNDLSYYLYHSIYKQSFNKIKRSLFDISHEKPYILIHLISAFCRLNNLPV